MEALDFGKIQDSSGLRTFFELSNLEKFMRNLDLKKFTIEFGLRQLELLNLENFSQVWT